MELTGLQLTQVFVLATLAAVLGVVLPAVLTMLRTAKVKRLVEVLRPYLTKVGVAPTREFVPVPVRVISRKATRAPPGVAQSPRSASSLPKG